MPLNEYLSGRDDHDDTVTVPKQISGKPINGSCFDLCGVVSSPLGYVTNTLVQFYTVEELTRANDILWDIVDRDVIGKISYFVE